jgi:hypothetical protein
MKDEAFCMMAQSTRTKLVKICSSNVSSIRIEKMLGILAIEEQQMWEGPKPSAHVFLSGCGY